MKKNIFSFIGSVLATISVFFLSAPYLSCTYEKNSSYFTSETVNTEISVQRLLGLSNSMSANSYNTYASISGILLIVSMFCAFAALIIVLTGILKKKNVNDKALILSSVNAFTIFYFVKELPAAFGAKTRGTYSFSVGWGIVCILVLFLAFFVLSLVGLIIESVSENMTAKEKNFDNIYRYKQLFDEGVITKQEFDEKKKQLLQ